MNLQLTLNKTILDSIIPPVSPALMDSNCRNIINRVDRHTVIVSNELIEIWESYAKEKGYLEDFLYWLYDIENKAQKFKKNSIQEHATIVGEVTDEEKVILDTSNTSDNKIVVGDYNSTLVRNNNLQFKFISNTVFNKNKVQEISLNDIENILIHKRYINNVSFFDIFETPIILHITPNGSSSLLSEYLSQFYKNSTEIVIQDKFLFNNIKNLDDYILPYIDKGKTSIKFIISSECGTRKNELKDYKGYTTSVKCEKDSCVHASFIESDRYRISLGYRLNIFGSRGKTNSEIIRIDKK